MAPASQRLRRRATIQLMPTFCRHNRLIQNCPICSKEQQVEMRAILSSSAPASSRPKGTSAGGGKSGERAGAGTGSQRATRSQRSGAGSGPSAVRVRRLARGADDGYHCRYLMGLKSSVEADRLASEIAFSAARLQTLRDDPPGLYAEVAEGDLEERTWLAFLIAYVGPLEDTEDPFEELRAIRTAWASSENPTLEGVRTGARSAYDPAAAQRTFQAYRAWAGRSGSQASAFAGEPVWTAQRRFARAYERLALPGFPRDARFELLVTLGRLGCYELAAGSLMFGGENEVTVAAKRALGIGDPLLLDRRAAELAQACGVELDVLDLALHNWGRGERAHVGVRVGEDPHVLAAARDALGLE
jgi:hypothetical protein